MRAMVIALVVLGAWAGRASAETCVALKKGAGLYSHADKQAKVGKATRKALAFVESKRGAWYEVWFEDAIETPDGAEALVAVFRATVREKDVRKAKCAREPVNQREPWSSVSLIWPNGRSAGWSVSEAVLGEESKGHHANGVPVPCYEHRRLGLSFVICADPLFGGDQR